MKNSANTKSSTLFLAALFILLCSLPAMADNQAYTKKKEINKSFNVSMSDLLQVDNRYGNITVAYWEKKEAAFRIVIESKASNESKAQAELDRVSIEIGKSGNTVSAVTNLASSSGNWSWNWGDGDNKSLTIHYYINIPNGLAMDLSQKYGNIDLPASNNGKCDLHVKYGNLSAGSFNAPLTVEAKYSNVTVGNITKAEMELGYVGSATVGNADELDVDSKYSNLTVKDAKKLSLYKKYGNLKAQTIGSLSLDMKYSEGTIQGITNDMNVGDMSYGSLTVKELSANFREVSISARYGSVSLGIPAKAAFKVNVENMKYSSYDIDGFNVTRSEKDEKKNFRTEVNNGGNRTIYFNGNGYSNLKINAY